MPPPTGHTYAHTAIFHLRLMPTGGATSTTSEINFRKKHVQRSKPGRFTMASFCYQSPGGDTYCIHARGRQPRRRRRRKCVMCAHVSNLGHLPTSPPNTCFPRKPPSWVSAQCPSHPTSPDTNLILNPNPAAQLRGGAVAPGAAGGERKTASPKIFYDHRWWVLFKQ